MQIYRFGQGAKVKVYLIQKEQDALLFANQQRGNSIQLQVKLEQDTVWLTVDQMARLFDRDVKTIRKHIINALREELDKSLVVAKFASTKKYGAMICKTQTNEVMFYNLEMVTSVARNLNGTE